MMQKLVICLLHLFSLGPLLMSPQDSSIKIAVLDKTNQYRISEATVINSRNKALRQTNLQGVCTIPVRLGDTLKISKSDYSSLTYTIKEIKDTVVYLSKVIDLREVHVYGQSKRSEMEAIMDDFRRKGSYFNGKPPALAFLASPITGFYELFGRTPRNARRFNSYMQRELEAIEIDKKFSDRLIKTVTGLVGTDLENFKFHFRPSFQEVQSWSEYDARLYIERSFKIFEERGRPEAPKLVPLQP